MHGLSASRAPGPPSVAPIVAAITGYARHYEPYFGTTDLLPPGEPGGGITGMVLPVVFGGLTMMPGSTLEGAMAPFCWASRPLKFPFGGFPFGRFPLGGAICSGGGEALLGGAIGTVGLAGDVGCGFCASTGPAARINTVSRSVRGIMRYPFVHTVAGGDGDWSVRSGAKPHTRFGVYRTMSLKRGCAVLQPR
jgi:hypothetical protein